MGSRLVRAFVPARIHPQRLDRGGTDDFDETIDKSLARATAFDKSKIPSDQVATSMGRKAREQQAALCVPADRIDASPGHAFYDRRSALLTKHGFDAYVEERCRAGTPKGLSRRAIAALAATWESLVDSWSRLIELLDYDTTRSAQRDNPRCRGLTRRRPRSGMTSSPKPTSSTGC